VVKGIRSRDGCAPAKVLLLQARTQLSHLAENDLRLAGFDVLAVADPRILVDAARGHALAAAVVPDVMPRGAWRRWTRNPSVNRIAVVTLTAGRPYPSWPFASLVRAGATVSAAELKRPGAAADAVRTSIARGVMPPTSRERLGEALWGVASVLKWIGFLLFLAVFPRLMNVSTPRLLLGAVALLSSSDVLGDIGGRLSLNKRVRLRRWTWVSIVALLGLGLGALLLAGGGR
jgi:hypothetical protein